MLASPSAKNNFLADHAALLISNYRHWTGRELLAAGGSPDRAQAAERLFKAPFAVVSHNTDNDPLFNYGNQTALELFELDWAEFTQLPSRQSAEPLNRAERARLLAAVTEHGFIDDYSGVRVSSSGRRFEIPRATVWNLIDEHNLYRGQAACFAEWRLL